MASGSFGNTSPITALTSAFRRKRTTLIINHPALFAFRIEHVTQADIAACDHLLLERMGDEIVIRTK